MPCQRVQKDPKLVPTNKSRLQVTVRLQVEVSTCNRSQAPWRLVLSAQGYRVTAFYYK
jgi:hypothetical protein